MMRAKELTGRVFGRLVVVRRAEGASTRHGVIWECLCSCGSATLVPSGNLVSGNTLSCGCAHKEQLSARNNLLALEPWLVDMNVYKRRLGYRKTKAKLGSNQFKAHSSGKLHPTLALPWDLSLEEYKTLVTSPRFYCGMPPKQHPHGVLLRRTGLKRNGIDRIDSSRGYSKENCVSCCKLCNMDKRAQTQAEFIDTTRRRYEHLATKGLITRCSPPRPSSS
jgi:hypothetical protein